MIRTIKPSDVTERENKVYAKIVKSNCLDVFELEELRDYVRQRANLKDKLSRRNMQIRELKKELVARDKANKHLNFYYSGAEKFIESKGLGTEWRNYYI